MRLTVGTTPILALNPNKKRRGWTVIMQPITIEAANTGNLHVGKGFQPVAIAGAPQQGFVLQQGASVGEEQRFEGDTSVFLGQIWLTANTEGQIAEVIEYGEN